MTAIPVLASIAPLAASADVWFLDIWGVLHNGVAPYASCVDACTRFRATGGKVVLVSNSPRPRDGVIRQLDQIGVDREAYDSAVTSGDVSRRLIADHAGHAVWHLGPHRDRPVFEGLDVALGDPASSEAIICTGLFDDERETPGDYESRLAPLAARAVPMVCVNPDVKVERGNRIIYCAGALAALYEDMGGKVVYAGKPYPPIYDQALKQAGELLGGTASVDRVLAIGDGVATDIEGAHRAGIRSVYIASRISVGAGEALEAASEKLFGAVPFKPIAVMPALAW